jgi:hypothetical protein
MATLVAEKDAEILCLGEESFNDLAVHHPQTAVKLLKGIIEVLSIRLDNAIDRVVEARAARRAWARLIKKIYEVDPLLCPECSGPMRIIAFIEEEQIIRKILEHLRLWEEPEPRSPPAVPEQVDIHYVPFFDS